VKAGSITFLDFGLDDVSVCLKLFFEVDPRYQGVRARLLRLFISVSTSVVLRDPSAADRENAGGDFPHRLY
jgi:hypothetical protein